jgi:alpha-tubulin suppressor-like RCC1 family protein
MPRSRISPSLINHNQGAGIKKKGLVSTIGYNHILSSVISRRVYPFNNNIIPNYKSFIKLSRSRLTSAALTTDGILYSWGYNGDGELGNGTTTDSNVPINTDILNISEITGGATHFLSLSTSNELYSWGDNQYGQLGNGTNNDSSVPVSVLDISGGLFGKTITQISCGALNSLVLTSDNKLFSWGYNGEGQLGNGTVTNSNVPVAVDMTGVLSGKTISQISCGYFSSLILTSDNKLYSWGSNSSGQLGDGTIADRNVPVAVDMTGALSGKTITQITCGALSCLVLTSDNKLYSWGSNLAGQLGEGTNTDSNFPVAVNMSGVLLGKTITQISSGAYYSLVLTNDNKLYSWGFNLNGQLGNGTITNTSLPVVVNMTGVLSGKTITEINCSGYHSLVLTSDGNLYSWGWNNNGQLGDGSNADRTVPVAVKKVV